MSRRFMAGVTRTAPWALSHQSNAERLADASLESSGGTRTNRKAPILGSRSGSLMAERNLGHVAQIGRLCSAISYPA